MPALPIRYLSAKPLPIPRLVVFLFSWKGFCAAVTTSTATGMIYAGRVFDSPVVMILGLLYLCCTACMLFLDATSH